MECFFQTQKNGWDGPVLGVKQATENKRQFDEEVEINSHVADFSNGGVYMLTVMVILVVMLVMCLWMLMRISCFHPIIFKSVIVKILGS